MPVTICAVIAARNEADYLRTLLPILASQEIDVIVIDNESTDDSREVYSIHAGSPIISVESIPYQGYFSLTEQLEVKQSIYSQIKHDWVIHHDADEILEHVKPGMNLRDAIQDAHESGYDVLNFDEFVFLPEPTQPSTDKNYYEGTLRYYFFEPYKNRLNRAWKRALSLDNRFAGGHQLSGNNLSIFPINHILRHYIALSYEHAIGKYLDRSFSPEDRQLGWHGNRLNFTKENLQFPDENPYLFRLESYLSKEFHKEKPTTKHYWEWDDPTDLETTTPSERKAGINIERTDKRLIVVLGMHRSGTSVITRALQVLGVNLGNKLLPPQEDNSTGFWEDVDLNALNIEILNSLNSDWHFFTPIQQADIDALRRHGYLQRATEMLHEKLLGVDTFGFKDPRVAKLLPFWKEVFAQSHLNVSYVLAIRHPLSVCKSLEKRHGFDLEKSSLLWLEHVINSLAGTLGESCIVVDYDRLLQSPDVELKRIAGALQLQVDLLELEKFMADFLNEGLRHTTYQLQDLMHENSMMSLIPEIYTTLLNVAADNIQIGEANLDGAIAQWKNEYMRLIPALKFMDKLDSKIRTSEIQLAEQAVQLTKQDALVATQAAQLTDQNVLLAEQTARLAERDTKTQILEAQLNEITRSKAWRTVLLLRRFKYFLTHWNH